MSRPSRLLRLAGWAADLRRVASEIPAAFAIARWAWASGNGGATASPALFVAVLRFRWRALRRQRRDRARGGP